jgi:hypothetical protein
MNEDMRRFLGLPTEEPETKPIPIRDRFLDLPKRVTVINDDDVLNVRIALETCKTVDELIESI